MSAGKWLALAALGAGAGYLLFRSRSASAAVDDQTQQIVDVPAGGVPLGPMPEEPLESNTALRNMVSLADRVVMLPSKGEYAIREDVVRPGRASTRASSEKGTLIIESAVPGRLCFSVRYPTGNEVDGGRDCELTIRMGEKKVVDGVNPGQFLVRVVNENLSPITETVPILVEPGRTTEVRLAALSGVTWISAKTVR